MENHTVLKPVELASYTHEILNSLRLPPLELPKGNKPGKMRGVEFYGRHLPDVLMECLTRYHRVHDRFPPPPLECQSINDKIFWSKFIVPMSVPTAADKLSVGKYIPKNLRSKIRPPKVYWISDRPNFPLNHQGAGWTLYAKGQSFLGHLSQDQISH